MFLWFMSLSFRQGSEEIDAMYAVIVTGGKQYKVAEGQKLRIEKLEFQEGQVIEFDKVLMTGMGDKVKIGAPFLKGGIVNATVVSHGRGKKIRIIKFRRRKNSRKQMGHRQDFTEVKIDKISA